MLLETSGLKGKRSQPTICAKLSYGIFVQLFGLLLSFLCNRRLRVVLEGKSLEEYPINGYVSQGSILGSTLFLLYIDYLPDDVCNIAVYVYDTTSALSLIRHLISGNN